MLRLFSLFLAFSGFLFQAQAQLPNTGGIPASVTSPTADGRLHGVPSSVVSPKPPIPGVTHHNHFVVTAHRRVRPFGTPRRRTVLVPVPLFYPAYGQTYDAESAVGDVADPAVTDDAGSATPSDGEESVSGDEEALRRAYLEGARDALARQAERSKHPSDSVESVHSKPQPQAQKESAPATAEEAAVEESPSTVFIFRDGHQIETRNFAIMGQTLYDFSSSGLKKLELSDLDTAATRKANDDRGIEVKLP